jgi:hypothetical protein
MYIAYINDRQSLGFTCLRDIEDAEIVSGLLSRE